MKTLALPAAAAVALTGLLGVAPAGPATAQSLAAPAGKLPKSGCQGHRFLVNDYGKEGPTNDAKRLLDKSIADWARSNGITKYRTGPKSVDCELYLDFGFFDEWTCTARARVCW